MIYVLTSGFLLGLMGSFHCVGMCGPIALSLPVHQLDKFQKTFSILLYNAGRVVAYSFLGFLFGLIGKGLFIGKYQQTFSVAIGILMLLAILIPKLFSNVRNPYIEKYTVFIRKKLSELFKRKKSKKVFFLIGFFNGFLPCGLVYFALASALALGNLQYSVLFMLMFGLATAPIMFALAFLGNFISTKFRQKINSVIPFFIGLMAILFILRGLNLDIPYISPKIKHTTHGTEQSCCRLEE